MRKHYSEPELEVREYTLFQGAVLTVSEPGNQDTDLDNDDQYDPFK